MSVTKREDFFLTWPDSRSPTPLHTEKCS